MKIRFQLFGHFYAASRVDLLNVFVEAPAPFCYAEQQIDKQTCGKKQIADDEIFGVKNIPAAYERYFAPDVINENTGNASEQKHRSVDKA